MHHLIEKLERWMSLNIYKDVIGERKLVITRMAIPLYLPKRKAFQLWNKYKFAQSFFSVLYYKIPWILWEIEKKR